LKFKKIDLFVLMSSSSTEGKVLIILVPRVIYINKRINITLHSPIMLFVVYQVEDHSMVNNTYNHVAPPTSNPAPVHPDADHPLPLGRIITPPLPLPEFDGLLFFSGSEGFCGCSTVAGSAALLKEPVAMAAFCVIGC
jgi:hypothetical protein